MKDRSNVWSQKRNRKKLKWDLMQTSFADPLTFKITLHLSLLAFVHFCVSLFLTYYFLMYWVTEICWEEVWKINAMCLSNCAKNWGYHKCRGQLSQSLRIHCAKWSDPVFLLLFFLKAHFIKVFVMAVYKKHYSHGFGPIQIWKYTYRDLSLTSGV